MSARLQYANIGVALKTSHVRNAIAAVRMPRTEPGPSQNTKAPTSRTLTPSFSMPWKMATPGPVRVAFGAPMRLVGEDYVALAKQVEDAVRAL